MAKRKQETGKKGKCLVGYCLKQQQVRGLCLSHYNYLTKLVKRGKAPTWKELEKQGKCLPLKKRGGGSVIAWLES